jgi:hypothetical protein
MNYIIICENHYLERVSLTPDEPRFQYPNTTTENVKRDGWMMYNGHYICPACVEKIRNISKEYEVAKREASKRRQDRIAAAQAEIEKAHSDFLAEYDRIEEQHRRLCDVF